MAAEIATGRGLYLLSSAAPLEADGESVTVTIAIERADGIERVVARWRIERVLLDEEPQAESIIERIAQWLALHFEATREAALKSVRSEHRLFEINFDDTERGPF
jgi:hypothetical protein